MLDCMTYDPHGSINPDLNGTVCCVGDCLRVADLVGVATIRLNPLVGAPGDTNEPRLAVLLCVEHAHLLRMGGTLIDMQTF
jgi:hypothetical protein